MEEKKVEVVHMEEDNLTILLIIEIIICVTPILLAYLKEMIEGDVTEMEEIPNLGIIIKDI